MDAGTLRDTTGLHFRRHIGDEQVNQNGRTVDFHQKLRRFIPKRWRHPRAPNGALVLSRSGC
jgi:hypothetical protein